MSFPEKTTYLRRVKATGKIIPVSDSLAGADRINEMERENRPKPNRARHLGFCSLVSLALTVSAVSWDVARITGRKQAEGLKWGRQIASQAEGLALQARLERRPDPIGWAASHLTQGTEPRLIQVTRLTGLELDPQAPESFELDSATGAFEYIKMLAPEEGGGIRVLLSLGYAGFLGAASPFAGDLLALLFFVIALGGCLLATGRLFGFDDARRLRDFVLGWVGGAKAQLTQLGVHIREMVRQSQRLAVTSGRSRALVGELRGKIHLGLTELNGSRKALEEADALAARAEALARDAVTEARRAGGGDPRRLAALTDEIRDCAQLMRLAAQSGQAAVASLERSVEPWATDADVAYHAFDEVKDATDNLSRHIRGTTETLIGQAKLIQSLNYGIREAPGSAEVPAANAAIVENTVAPAPRLVGKMPKPLPAMRDASTGVSAKTSLVDRVRRKKG